MQISKEGKQKLKTLSEKLPVVFTNTYETQLKKGSEILEWRTIKKIDGVKIQKDKMYLNRTPLMVAHNHYRRLKKAYLKLGIEGVKSYLETIKNTIKENEKINSNSNANN